MDDGLKQRLIGAIIIVAAAIIFIPMIFNDADHPAGDILVDIPARPEPPPPQLIKPTQPSLNVEEVAGVNVKQEVTEQEPGNLPVSWVLQFASFQEPKNAEALRDRLRKAGYKSYVAYRPDQTDTMARVLVGPELDRKEVERLAVALKKEFKLEGFIVRYLP